MSHTPVKGDEFVQNSINDVYTEAMKHLDAANSEALNSALTSNFIRAVGAIANKAKEVKSSAPESKRRLLEFCCHPESNLGAVADSYDLCFTRLSRDFADIHDPIVTMQIVDLVDTSPPMNLWGRLPCTVWSSWQHMSVSKCGEAYAKRSCSDVGLSPCSCSVISHL